MSIRTQHRRMPVGHHPRSHDGLRGGRRRVPGVGEAERAHVHEKGVRSGRGDCAGGTQEGGDGGVEGPSRLRVEGLRAQGGQDRRGLRQRRHRASSPGARGSLSRPWPIRVRDSVPTPCGKGAGVSGGGNRAGRVGRWGQQGWACRKRRQN